MAQAGVVPRVRGVSISWFLSISALLVLAIVGTVAWQAFPTQGEAVLTFERPDIAGLTGENPSFPTNGYTDTIDPVKFEAMGLRPRVVVVYDSWGEKVYLVKHTPAPAGDWLFDYYRTRETIFQAGYGRGVDSVDVSDEGVITVQTDRSFNHGDKWSAEPWVWVGVVPFVGVVVALVLVGASLAAADNRRR